MAGKAPYFPFYADDWLSDEKLRSCSSEAIGLWIDMLCLMHKNDRRGYLQIGGKPVTATQLARMTGRTTDEVSRQLAELLNSGVPSVTEHGLVYSRKMVRQEQKRQLCSDAGKRGGNPTLKGHSKGEVKGRDKHSLEMELKNGILEDSGGVGAKGENPPTPVFELSAAGLAQAWCFLLTRQKIGAPKDLEHDMVPEFAELIRLGYPAEQIRAAVLAKERDRGEHFWQFKDRLRKQKVGAVFRPQETEAETKARIAKQRAEDAKRSKNPAKMRDIAAQIGRGPDGLPLRKEPPNA